VSEPSSVAWKFAENPKMSRNRTTNQLAVTPMRMPKTRASWMEPPVGMGHMVAGACRATIAFVSTPAGSVP
jgi:hypothetical protein